MIPAMLHIASSLKKILLQKSVRTGTFTLASGKQSDLYIDCRMTALDPFGANLIGDLGWHAVRSKIHSEHLKIDAIGGMTLGADPISLAVGMTSATKHPEEVLQVFTVRKEPKGHGAGKQIEGNFKSGDTVIVVDDVITTGGVHLESHRRHRTRGRKSRIRPRPRGPRGRRAAGHRGSRHPRHLLVHPELLAGRVIHETPPCRCPPRPFTSRL